MKKVVFVLIILLGVWAFTMPEDDSLRPRLVRHMLEYVKYRPQEKVYLQTDRDHYEVGEKVWFKAYLTNAVTHQMADLSRFVYVELRDRQDSLCARLKIMIRDSVFSGFMPLPSEKLLQGDYFLRAYSYWMQNAGDDYIFRKKIRVINPKDTRVQAKVSYEETGKGKFARIRFYNSRQEAYGKVFIDYEQNGKMHAGRTDENGYMDVKLDTADFGKKMLVRFKDEDPFVYERYIYLPDPRKDFEVTLLPEGGDLLEGCQQIVAFKAIGTDGLSRDVTGIVMNDKGEQVAWTKSLHKGMGAFDLRVEPGQRYYAVFSTDDSIQKRFELPLPQPNSMALRILSGAEALGYIVLAADSAQMPEHLYLVAHNRGVPLICQEVRLGTKGRIRTDNLPEGILHLLLMDGTGKVYSQRLCFIKKQRRPEILLVSDKSGYNVREQVRLNIQIAGDSLPDLRGSFSISVTDDGKCERDTLQDNILSYLLLSSDLKGYIEDPAYYFKDNRIVTRRFLDLLMMTHGWTRFDVSKVINQEVDTLEYYMERGQAVSGKVKNFWGKDAINANLVLLSTSGILRLVNADSTGHFVIDGIAFPDSTKFVLQGKSKKGRRSVEVIVDQDKFMAPTVKYPYKADTLVREDDFYKRFSRDYYYDNGVKVYVLDEAVVKRKVKRESYSFYDNMADYNLDSVKLASMENMDIRMVLQELPGVDAMGPDDSVTRFGKPLYVLVNDFNEDMNYVMNLRPSDLVSISLIKSPLSATLFGEKAANGAIIITTNPNFVPRDVPRPNMVSFSLLGYQKKAEFYIPHYEVDSVRLALTDSTDQRVTIYWNPDIRTNTAGKAECFFTTSDSYGPYTVTIEGILNNGTVCRKEEKITLKSWQR